MTRAALLLAGGAGTRLWPLSSDENPKQFLPLFGGQSLLRKTYERVRGLEVFVSTNERYAAKVQAELPELPAGRIITEPARRNTGPALALCCAEIASQLGDETVIACLPSDHFIEDEPGFSSVLLRAFAHAEENEHLVTVAIAATEPNTGYGYLELGDEIAPGVLALRRFVEKPDAERAAAFLRAGTYAWNGGIFVWRASVFRRELESAAPGLAAVTRETYAQAASVSIDYALMEKSSSVASVPGDFGWSDVGTWAAVARLAGPGNAPLFCAQASNVFAETTSGRPVIVVGVDNVAIVDSPEGILVLNLAKAELLSDVVKKLG